MDEKVKFLKNAFKVTIIDESQDKEVGFVTGLRSLCEFCFFSRLITMVLRDNGLITKPASLRSRARLYVLPHALPPDFLAPLCHPRLCHLRFLPNNVANTTNFRLDRETCRVGVWVVGKEGWGRGEVCG